MDYCLYTFSVFSDLLLWRYVIKKLETSPKSLILTEYLDKHYYS